jgi:hypothetical protein
MEDSAVGLIDKVPQNLHSLNEDTISYLDIDNV